MNTKAFMLALLAGSSTLCAAAPAFAQEPPVTAAPTDDEVSTPMAAEPAPTPEESAAKAAFLEEQVNSLQEQINALKTQLTKATPTWKGAPQWDDKEAGWSFKVRGRFQYDTAFIDSPFSDALKPNKNLGFNSRVRRIRLGVEGAIPGDFGYKFEADFANAAVAFGDVILTYTPKGKPWSVTIGNHDTFQGLDRLTSSRFSSFIERAQMSDAYTHDRRLGLSFGLQNPTNTMRFNAGMFAAHSIDASIDNDGWIGAARAVYSPQAFGGMLHLGVNYQHREFQSNSNATASTSVAAPSINQIARYRARPFLTTTGERFVDTGNFAAKSDDIIGAELGGVFGSLHIAGEAQYTKVKAYRAGDISTGLDAFTGGTLITPSGNPSFFSWYAEAGYFLTGESRGYKNGAWDRTKVLNPFDKGGWGAFQINARYDYLDLDSNKLKTAFSNNFATGVAAASNNLSRGGKQTGYLLGLTWIPQDYVRFLLQYAHTEVEGGPFAAAARPNSTKPIDERGYGFDSVAIRAQFDF